MSDWSSADSINNWVSIEKAHTDSIDNWVSTEKADIDNCYEIVLKMTF